MAKYKVTELFSPPRVTAEMQSLPILGFVPGSTFDLRVDSNGVSWDFLRADDRRRARNQIQKEKPYLVCGSPPCTYYSILTRMNFSRMDPEKLRRKKSEAKVLLDFAMEIYEVQLQGGRRFLHEHPESASSWKTEEVQRLLWNPRVGSTVAHLCQFGMKTRGQDGEWRLARKATRFMSSSVEILKRLEKKCQRDHVHQHLVDGRAKGAAIYPPMLCRAILRGIGAQNRKEGRKRHAETRGEYVRQRLRDIQSYA